MRQSRRSRVHLSTGAAALAGWTLGQALDSVLGAMTGGGVNSLALGSFAQASLLAGAVVYDKRGLAVASHEPGRQVADTGSLAAVTGTVTATLVTQRLYNAFGEVRQEQSARRRRRVTCTIADHFPKMPIEKAIAGKHKARRGASWKRTFRSFRRRRQGIRGRIVWKTCPALPD